MRKNLVAAIATMSVLAAGTAMATTWAEVGDAGETLATAQVLSAGTTKVTGAYSTTNADLYSFGWGGGAFYANTVGTPGDSQLFLFNSLGQGVQANDDGIAFAGPAYLQLLALTAGTYYLGVSGYDNDPLTAAGALMFQSSPFAPLYGPLSPTATLDHWSNGSGYNDNYVINFSMTTSAGQLGDENPTGDPSAPVPEPSTMLLLGGGLAGLAFWRKRKNA